MRSFAFASHVALVKGKEYDGIGNALKDVLPGITDEFIFVRHSMDGNLTSEVQYFNGEELSSRRTLSVVSRFGPLRYISEVYSTVRFFRKNPVDVFVGIDPLNALAGVILKRKGSVKKAIFYTPDYSPNRFSSKLLNYVYHKIDVYCVKRSDEVWSVSPRIVEIRRSMGLSEDKNILLPNVPPEKYDYLKGAVRDKDALFTCGIIDTQLDFEVTIRAIEVLKQELPRLRFVIVGNGPEEERLKLLATELGVADRVEFKGRLGLAETLEETSKAGIGLALYTGVWGFNKYGDSTKCREFANFGLPIITTDTHATVPDIESYGAGVVIERDLDQVVQAIRDVMGQYDKYSFGSSKLGDAHSGAHRKILERILGA